MTRRRSGGGKRKKPPWWRYIWVLVLLGVAGGAMFFASDMVTGIFRPAGQPADDVAEVPSDSDAAPRPQAPAATPPARGSEDGTAAAAEPPPRHLPAPAAAKDAPEASATGQDTASLPYTFAASLLLPLVAGFIGGWLAFGWARRSLDAELQARDQSFVASWRNMADEVKKLRQRIDDAGSAGPPPPRWNQSDTVRRGLEVEWDRAEHRDRETEPDASRPAPPAPQPDRIPPDLSGITARFGQLTRGNISRAEFNRFFGSLGGSVPVESAEGGSSISEVQTEGFLSAVSVDGRRLVFPSYNFVANWHSQFATMASVPENVAELFDLARGDGEIVMTLPAVFDDDPAAPRRLQRGEIRGFPG